MRKQQADGRVEDRVLDPVHTPLTVGVVTGGHTFDVVGFHRLFRALEGCDCYLQALEEWAVDRHRFGRRYDALVFYHMHPAAPAEGPGGRRTRQAVEALGTDAAGIVVLHHGILAFKEDPTWDAIVGLTGRTLDGYAHDQRLRVHVADPDHPITRGLTDFDLVDETYDMGDVAGPDSHVLLTVDHPHSMSTMAWTRKHGQARVLNLVFGHDDQAWSDPTFRTLLGRGIRWSAGVEADRR